MSVQQCNHLWFVCTELSGGKVTLQISYKVPPFPDGNNNYQSNKKNELWLCAPDGNRNAVIQWIAVIATVHNQLFNRNDMGKKTSEYNNYESQREYTEYNIHWYEIWSIQPLSMVEDWEQNVKKFHVDILMYSHTQIM